MYPAGSNFMSDVLRQRTTFETLDFKESYKQRICLEVNKIYRELEFSKVYVTQHGSSHNHPRIPKFLSVNLSRLINLSIPENLQMNSVSRNAMSASTTDLIL
jgi:hypothetical protein